MVTNIFGVDGYSSGFGPASVGELLQSKTFSGGYLPSKTFYTL